MVQMLIMQEQDSQRLKVMTVHVTNLSGLRIGGGGSVQTAQEHGTTGIAVGADGGNGADGFRWIFAIFRLEIKMYLHLYKEKKISSNTCRRR